MSDVVIWAAPPQFLSLSMARYAASLESVVVGMGLRVGRMPHPDRVSGRARTTRLGGHVWRLGRLPVLAAQGSETSIHHLADGVNLAAAVPFLPGPVIATVQDVFPVERWAGSIVGVDPKHRPVTVELALRMLRRADRIVVPSRATADSLSALGFSADRLHVIPNPVDGRWLRPRTALLPIPLVPDDNDSRPGALILCIDSGAAYKNRRAMVEVLHRVCANAARPVRLVHVGSFLDDASVMRAEALGVGDRIVDLGPVSDEDLAQLYARCDVLLFPSHFEGFGWPPLEAMAAGLPVVCSEIAPLAEVVGDAAIRAGADDYDGLARGVLRIFDDGGCATVLRMRGLDRASRFTWESYARGLSTVYHDLLERTRRQKVLQCVE